MNEIKQYVRKGRRRARVGVMIAVKGENGVCIGWSKCCIKKAGVKLDKFDLVRGLQIARERAEKGSGEKRPSSMKDALQEFTNRASRYFKGNKITLQGK